MNQLNHTPEDIECFKVLDDKAYFQIGGRSTHYQFASKKEAEAWRNRRSLENRKSKVYEDFMACDESGLFCPIKRLKIYQTLGLVPPSPTCLMEFYAFEEFMVKKRCENIEDEGLYDYFQKNKLSQKPFFRKIVSNQISNDRKHKLRQLAEASNLPAHFGELLLNEIKLSTDKENSHLRDRARFLGLMK